MQKPFAECRIKLRDWIALRLLLNDNSAPSISVTLVGPSETYVRPWYPELTWEGLSANPHQGAINLLRKCPEFPANIEWTWLSANPHPWAVEMLQKHPEKIDWGMISANPHPWAVKEALQNTSRMWWLHAARNTNPLMIHKLLCTPGFSIDILLGNPHPDAVAMVQQQYAREFPDWRSEIAANPHPWAVDIILSAPLDSLCAYALSRNPHPKVLELLRLNPEMIRWNNFSSNPAIFVDEYPPIARAYFREHVAAELMAHVWHPRNMGRFKGLGVDADA